MTSARRWLHVVTFIGALINIFGMALPFIFQPFWYMNGLGLPVAGDSVIWMRQAGLLLLFISILYIPGGRDPFRYRLNAYFAVGVRMVIGLYWFFLVYAEGRTYSFLKFGYLDVIYAIFNGVLLLRVLKSETSPRPQ